MALACALIFDKAANWEIIPIHLRREHATEAWVSAGRLVLRRDPRTARDYFARARRYRASVRVLAYSTVALGLSLFRPRRSSPSLPTAPTPRPPLVPRV